MRKRIIVVDDERNICLLVKVTLEARKYKVDCAYDGRSGLDMIIKNKYDLVILNVMMPYLDGFEVCREIKSRPELTMPIIIESCSHNRENLERAAQLGADAFMVVPFEPSKLVSKIKDIFAERADAKKRLKRAEKKRVKEANGVL